MLDVTKDTFEAEVLQHDGPVLVDFYGDSCVPCKELLPHIEKLHEEYGDQIKMVTMNTSKARRVAIAHRVIGLPTVAVFNNGEKVEEVTVEGATADSVKEMLLKYI